MGTKEKYADILKQYPENITKEQLYKICKISKRHALFLLESGYIPNTNSGKKTRKYTIKTTDVVDFLKKREKNPSHYLPPCGWYKKDYTVPLFMMTPESVLLMRKFITEQIEKCNDVLNVHEVSEFTGYTKSSVIHWCASKKLNSFFIHGANMIPKECLIDFMTSISYININMKSEKHKSMLLVFAKYEESYK